MAPLRLAGVAAALLACAPGIAQIVDPVARWRQYTGEASMRFGMPVGWIERVMRAESGGRTSLDGRPITSRAGAMGLMQLMPGTWAEMRAALDLGPDPYDPRDNILAGSFYLQLLYQRFGHPGLFAAYHAGPTRYAAYLAGRRALPAETRAYVQNVGGSSGPLAVRLAPAPRPAFLFAVRAGRAGADPKAIEPSKGSLFAIRYDR